MTDASSAVARMRPPVEPLDPRTRLLWRIEIAAGTAIVVLAGALALALAAMAGDPPVGALSLAIGIVAAVGAALVVVVPARAYRAFRFEVTPLGMVVRQGWIFETTTVVPHSRIQSVQTTSDPLRRALGLATVEVRTASSAVARIPGLDAARVATLQADLAAMAGEGPAT